MPIIQLSLATKQPLQITLSVRPSVFPFASQIELIELMRLSLFWPDSGIRLEDSVQRFDNVLALVLHHSTHW